MRISAIQPNYINRIPFKQNGINTTDKPADETSKNLMNKNTQIAVTAGLGTLDVVGSVYIGYRGKSGAKIQNFSGGANDMVKNAERNMSDANVNGPKPNVKPDNVDINSNSTTDIADDVKVIGGEQPKKVFDASDAEDVEIIKELHKFLTPEEFKSLPREELIKRVGADLEEISGKSANAKEYIKATENYFKKYDLDIRDFEDSKENLNFLDIALEQIDKKFIDEFKTNVEYYEFKLARAHVKILMSEKSNVEKSVMEVINNTEVSPERLGAYTVLKEIANESENPEKYSQILNDELKKDFKTANELQTAVKEHIEKYGARQQDLDNENSVLRKYMNSKVYFETMDSIFNEISITNQEESIKEILTSIVEKNREIDELIKKAAK